MLTYVGIGSSSLIYSAPSPTSVCYPLVFFLADVVGRAPKELRNMGQVGGVKRGSRVVKILSLWESHVKPEETIVLLLPPNLPSNF